MAEQSMSDLKVAVIELDGCIFPLNKYRFNFYKNLCKQKDVPLTADVYYKALGNMYTMYDQLPLSYAYNPLALNQKVEKDLLRYAELKNLAPYEGIKELIAYFQEKAVKVVVVSTHKTKDTLAYLKMADLFDQIDYVIGSDTKLKDIPTGEVFAFLRSKYDVTYNQMLILTSLTPFCNAAYKAGMNVIYVEDLVKASDNEKEKSFAIVENIDDVLKTVIEGRYEDVEKFEDMLGLNEGMSRDELKRVYDHLCHIYEDDQHMLDIVNRTYEYRLSQLRDDFAFDGEDVLEADVPEIQREMLQKTAIEEAQANEIDVVHDESVIETPLQKKKAQIEDQRLKEEEMQPIVSPEQVEEETFVAVAEPEEVVVEVEEAPEAETAVEEAKKGSPLSKIVVDEEEEKPKKKRRNPFLMLLDFIVGIIYVLVLSALVILIGIIVYVAFMDYFKSGQPEWLIHAFDIYSNTCNTIVKFVLDTLHGFIASVPSYETYLNNSQVFSVNGAHLFNIYCIDTIIIGFFEIIISIFTKDE